MALFVDIEKRLGNFHLNVKFEAGNEVLALLGASGCGKSMTLKCIAGIETPDRGKIILDGVALFDSEKKINLPPQKRRVGYLFQQYALFPHMAVEQNIACGVKEKEKKTETTAKMIEMMGLSGLEKKRPYQLSGGQQQRAALARILVNAPEVLLLDEPFSALDTHLRFHLERQVQKIMNDFGKTVILISHDREEAFRLSEKIAIMGNGTVETVGEKTEVFCDPKTKNGALLTGCKNISKVRKLDDTHVFAEDWGMELAVPFAENVKYIGMRMHDILIHDKIKKYDENIVICPVVGETEEPFSYTIWLAGEKEPLGVSVEKALWENMRAEELTVCLPKEKLLLLRD